MRRLAAVLVLTGLAAGAAIAFRQDGTSASAGGSEIYVTFIDNADNNWNHVPDAGHSNGDMYPLSVRNTDPWHPVEFYINVSGPVRRGTLNIRAYAVESSDANADGCGYPEVDTVHLNDHLLGTLVGTGGWDETIFQVPSSYVAPGDNRVRIDIDPGHPGTGCIAAVIDWGVLDLSPAVGGTTELSGVSGGRKGGTSSNARLAIAAAATLALSAGSAYALRRKTGRR